MGNMNKTWQTHDITWIHYYYFFFSFIKQFYFLLLESECLHNISDHNQTTSGKSEKAEQGYDTNTLLLIHLL